jgi:hypothetical protein
MTYTESIYSTNTEEDTNRRRSAPSVVEDSPRPSSTHGDVMIFVKPLDYNKRSLSLPAEKRVSSTSSSVEWKTWLSSNVSKLEESTTHVNCTDFQYGLSSARSSGHVRENAQINDDEDQIPDACHTKEHGLLNLNRDIGDNQPTSFDAGEKFNTIRQSRGPYTNPFPTSISTLSVVSAGEQLKTSTQKNVTKGQSSTDREKPLPKVPSLNSSKNRLNITMKLVKRKPKITNNMVPLASLSDSGEKAANSQRQMDDMASAKTENVSPFALHNNNDDNVDPYEVDGAGVLGPHQQTLGSNRMVDIFLSSRRRRMASTDEGSVFL